MSQEFPKNVVEFYKTLAPEQLEALLGLIHDIQASQGKNSDTEYVQAPMPKKSKGAVSRRTKLAKSGVLPAGMILAAKRPLNSWIAFRSYYVAIFPFLQQKDISGFLKQLWADDLFRAKWTIVAKAYSVIRDQVGKVKAPLDIFLQIACPVMGIISPDKYLVKNGWRIDEDDKLEKLWVPTINDFTLRERSSGMSVDNLIAYCKNQGYVVEDIEPTVNANTAALTMATEPADFGDDNVAVDSGPFEPVSPEEFATQLANNPIVSYEVNNILLAASGDSYPYHDQFEPGDVAAGFGLNYDPNGGDEFRSFDINAPCSNDEYFNDEYFNNKNNDEECFDEESFDEEYFNQQYNLNLNNIMEGL